MKQGCVFLLMLLVAPAVYSQEQTLISGEIEHGGFGGPVVKFTQFNGEFGIMVGGRGAWVLNHVFTLGGGGYGLANDVVVAETGLITAPYLNLGYGGLEMGFIISSRELVHLEINTLIGAGGVSYRSSFPDHQFEMDENGDAFFVLEPGVNAELNVTKFFRFAAGVSYRYTSGANYENIDDDYLRGLSAVVALKFGSF